jgi:hypothetical protein
VCLLPTKVAISSWQLLLRCPSARAGWWGRHGVRISNDAIYMLNVQHGVLLILHSSCCSPAIRTHANSTNTLVTNHVEKLWHAKMPHMCRTQPRCTVCCPSTACVRCLWSASSNHNLPHPGPTAGVSTSSSCSAPSAAATAAWSSAAAAASSAEGAGAALTVGETTTPAAASPAFVVAGTAGAAASASAAAGPALVTAASPTAAAAAAGSTSATDTAAATLGVVGSTREPPVAAAAAGLVAAETTLGPCSLS